MTSEIDRLRNIRKRAQRLGFSVSKQPGCIVVLDGECELFSGPLDEAETWIADRFEGRRPGPPAQHIPDGWRPWIDVFVAEQRAAKRRPGTTQKRIHHLMMFQRRRPDLTPLTVTRSDLIDYLSDNDWSPRTTHSFRCTFRVFFRLLCELGHRPDNPARTLPAVAIPRSVPRPCPDHVVRAAIAEAVDDRARLALRIAMETGMRRFEIASMRRDDVVGGLGTFQLHVVGKGGHERLIPIGDNLADEILTWPTGCLFEGTVAGRPMTPAHLGVIVASALPGGWTAHTLRHRFATKAYQATSDLRAVQELLGHASPTTTAIYTKVADRAMRAAAMAAG